MNFFWLLESGNIIFSEIHVMDRTGPNGLLQESVAADVPPSAWSN
jgi:hypothetical protein